MTVTAPTTTDNASSSVGELLISADSHVVEPRDLWERRLPPALRDKLPPLPHRGEDKPGATDPADRPGVMATDGVSMEVLYPTYGLTHFGLEDPGLQRAAFNVYNDWVLEYCATAPDRLVGVPSISAYDIDQAVADLHHYNERGLRGALLWHVPPSALTYNTDHYDRLWAAASEAGIPINLHILSGFSYTKTLPSTGVERYRGTVEYKLGDAIHVLFDFIFYGVLERFPSLKLVLVEFEIGWLPWLLQQWDFYVKRVGSKNPLPISLLPSEYFERQVYATFVKDAVGSSHFASGWGIRSCMWSSDFPHGNTSWPDSRMYIARDLDRLDPADRARLVRHNAAELYGLDLPTPISGPGKS